MSQPNSIRNVCVIGAGTMGSGIAAHLVNLGLKVTLFDQTMERAVVGFDRAKMAKPPHFFLPERANQVRLGGVDLNSNWILEADWVVEAVAEKLEVKRELYASIEPYLREDAFISTNTSGLEIAHLAEGRSDSFRRRFVGTHFFNPPRYLKLLELIPTAETDPAVVQTLTAFLEDSVGRRVVPAKDTPGFIANRYGMWCMYLATHVAEKLRLTVEQVDAITGPFIGRPKSGTFRLNDLVGLDVMEDIASNLIQRCVNDAHVGVLHRPESINSLMARGFLGEKSGQGYYRRDGKQLLSFDLVTNTYRERMEPELPSISEFGKLPLAERLRAGLAAKDEVGEYLRMYLLPILRYANVVKEEVSYGVQDFDPVMKWGFGWEMGPFEMIDAIGAEQVGVEPVKFYSEGKIRSFTGEYVEPIARPEYATLGDLPVLEELETFRVQDLGDGVRAVVLKTKLGLITPALVAGLSRWLTSQSDTPLVLTTPGKAYSVGFDLNFFHDAIQKEDWASIDLALQDLQTLGELLEARRTVAAIHGYGLGAGFELARSCSRIVAAADAQIGLPESKVGLLPGGRGVTLMRLRHQATAATLADACLTLTEGKTSINADQARSFGYLGPDDVTCYHPDRLLWQAKQVALEVTVSQRPEWKDVVGPTVGMIDRLQKEKMAKGDLTEYDEVIGDRLKAIFAKTNSYENALRMERSEFLDLCQRNLSQVRLRHMIEHKTALRN
jgi:3-hydroxyacyl-CoA dehydrogenase